MLLKLMHGVKRPGHAAAFSIALVSSLLALIVWPGQAQAQTPGAIGMLSPDSVQPLKSKQGYALFELDVSGVAPSLQFALLERRTNKRPSGIKRRGAKSKGMLVDLKDLEKGLYLLPLPTGWYQITSVNAPYFNLPFRMETKGQPQWWFVVYPGKTSYVGQLSIAKERSLSAVDIKLRNRVATTLDDIKDQLAPVLAVAPLVMGRGMRDDFLSDLDGDEAKP